MAFALWLALQSTASKCVAALSPSKLIAWDPYEYENVSPQWLGKEIERLEILAAWGKLSKDDEIHLRHMRDEVRSRARIDEILRKQDPKAAE